AGQHQRIDITQLTSSAQLTRAQTAGGQGCLVEGEVALQGEHTYERRAAFLRVVGHGQNRSD
ncbi:MAG: hypothetical protein ACI9SE_001620, partial [Neolewinella sp.]